MWAKQQQWGFTIVELLIVIVVIAILAAISIVAYSGIQNRANDAAVQTELKQNAAKLAEYQSINNAFPSASSSQLTGSGIKFNKSAYSTTLNNVFYCRDNTSDNFSLTVTSKSGTNYTVGSSNMTVRVYSGGWLAANICPATGLADYTATAGYSTGSGWSAWTNN